MNVFFLFRVAPLGAAAKVTLFSSPASFFSKKISFLLLSPYRFCGRQKYDPFPFHASFSEFFFHLSRYCILSMNVALISGAKVKNLFDSCKFIFRKIFSIPKLASCQYLPMNFAFIAGAKVAPFSAFANFTITFF